MVPQCDYFQSCTVLFLFCFLNIPTVSVLFSFHFNCGHEIGNCFPQTHASLLWCLPFCSAHGCTGESKCRGEGESQITQWQHLSWIIVFAARVFVHVPTMPNAMPIYARLTWVLTCEIHTFWLFSFYFAFLFVPFHSRDENNFLIAAWYLSDHNATWSAITQCCPDMIHVYTKFLQIYYNIHAHYYRIYIHVCQRYTQEIVIWGMNKRLLITMKPTIPHVKV